MGLNIYHYEECQYSDIHPDPNWTGALPYLTCAWQVMAFSTINVDVNEIRDWCESTFGPNGERWQDDLRHGEVRFATEEDATIFIMRWS